MASSATIEVADLSGPPSAEHPIEEALQKQEEAKGGAQYAMDGSTATGTMGQDRTSSQANNVSNGSVPGYQNSTDAESGILHSAFSSKMESQKGTNIFQKIKFLVTNKQAMLSLIFNLVVVIICNFVYLLAGFFANKRYLTHTAPLANASQECNEKIGAPLWDVVLNIMPDHLNIATGLTSVADAVPMVCLGFGVVYSAIYCYVDIINHVTFMTNFLILGNLIAENVTVLPSSYGRERCLRFINFTEETVDKYEFGFNPTGTCAAMVWSGHTVHTMLGVYALFTALERTYPGLKNFWNSNRYLPSGKSAAIILIGIIEGLLLLFNFGHYTLDIYLGMLISMLVMSSDKVKWWATRTNPFLKNTPLSVLRSRFDDSLDLRSLVAWMQINEPETLQKFKQERELFEKEHKSYGANEMVKLLGRNGRLVPYNVTRCT